MRRTKYNPGYHKSVVDNVRAECKRAGIDSSGYTDEEVWKVFEECYLSTEEESSEARLDMIKTGQKV